MRGGCSSTWLVPLLWSEPLLEQTRATRPVVVGLGEVLWDFLPAGPRLGGAPANFAAHAGAMGANAFVVGAVGNDELGNRAISKLEQLSVGTKFLTRVDEPTGTVQVKLSDGQPTYLITENVAWDRCPWSPSLGEFAASVDAVCFGTLFQRAFRSRETLRQFLAATQNGCLRVFDVNLRQHDCSEETIEKSLKLANALKLNDGELPLVARAVRTNSQPEEFAKSMIERFELRLLMLTAGEKGSFLFTATESSYVEAAEVEVIDTIGAGDAFAAAAVMGLIGNRPLADFHQQASDYASGVCTTAGAMPKSTID